MSRHSGIGLREISAIVLFAGLSLAPQATPPTGISVELLRELSWRNVGPFRGGRTTAVAGVPSQPNVFYFGAANGGVWKTTDAGRTWRPVFDGQPAGSIGAIAIAPSNPE